MLKKMTIIVTVLVMLSMVLTACSGSATPAPAPTQPPAQQPAAAPTQPPTQQPAATPAQSSAPQPTKPPAQPAASTAAQDLTGTVWKWTTSLFNDGATKTPDDPNKYLLEFLPQGNIAITADCNRVAGTYTTNGNQLTITPGPSTMAACPPGSLGDEYVRQLTTVTSYFFKDGNLILEFKFDSGSMTFAPSAPTGLSGSAWTVVNYNNGNQAVVTLITGSEVSLNFGADGQVSGNAGCNQYSGAYQAEGANLKVGPLVNTSMACASPEGVMEQETKYLAALQNAATYKIEGNTLTIRDSGGAMQVVATKATAASGLGGTAWTVINYNNGNQAVVGMITGSEVTLNFGADGQLSGSAGCNRYNGAYQAEGQSLKVGQLATTMMMCASPAGVMEQETKYLAALQKAATYSIDGNMLTIRDASGAMQVVATKATAAAGLSGTAWKVINYNNGNQAVVGMITGSEVTLNFGADGQVNGSAGCNRYTGTYQAAGEALKIGKLATTMMACASPEGVMEQETKYLTALQNAATYSLDGSTLTIRDASGAMQVVATVASAPAGLGGSEWKVVNYNNGKQAVVTLIPGSDISLGFGADGEVTGSGGCNRYFGPYQSQNATLQVGPLASTRMACETPEGVMEQETQYLTALQEAATYTIEGSTLTIRDAGGAMQVVATR